MKAPKILGFPLWKGKIKKRYLNQLLRKRYGPNWRVVTRRMSQNLGPLGIGDIVHDCSGFNVKITRMDPGYYKPFKRGSILWDVDIYSSHNSASLMSCGVTAPLPFEYIKRKFERRIAQWEKEDPWDNLKRWKGGHVNPDGTFTYPDELKDFNEPPHEPIKQA